ncbi:MAG: hypoxanthine phosphoribosyltransferase [Chloroflexi bacterium]|nr:hypoxanthine phosphoribosyltransferase [Chloroflexota bacterium]
MPVCYKEQVLARLSLLISRDQIAESVHRLSRQVEQDYRGSNLLLVGVLKGAFMFMADLVRGLELPVEIDFVRLASYGSRRQSTGGVRLQHGLRSSIEGKDVLIVEDIIDTGHTTRFLIDYLQKRRPASLKLCALLDKPERRQVPVSIDYLGFTVPNKFVVGYGIDFNQEYRHLPDIFVLEEKENEA